MARKRQFGSVRKLPSGRYQASYLGADSKRVNAPTTFTNKTDANNWLANVQSEKVRGVLRQPKGKLVSFNHYANEWLEHRSLRVRSRNMYRYLLDRYMLSPDYGLGSMALLAIDPGTVRKWYGKIGTATGPAMQGACYRLLRAILNTAAEDELIPYSPCKIKGAGRMKPKDRDILSTDQIGAIADAIYPRYRALVYLTAYTGLRRAEIVGLRRCDIDLNDKVVHVRQIMGWVDGQWLTGPPKSDAGKRSIDLPHFVADIMMEHLSKYVVEENDALVFTSVTGKPIHTGMLSRGLTSAGKKIGRPDVHMHLLRHTHLTMVRQAGATEKELMTRGGHSDIRAAMLYQHTTRERGRKLAYRLGEMALEMNTAIDLDSMTVPQLRQYARNVGLSSITRLDKKQELVVAIKRVQEKYPGRYV